MNNLLFIVNDARGTKERAYNPLRLAGTPAARNNARFRMFLMADAEACAKSHQRAPEEHYNIELMLSKITRMGAIALYRIYVEAQGLNEPELIEGTWRSRLTKLADGRLEADKVTVFR